MSIDYWPSSIWTVSNPLWTRFYYRPLVTDQPATWTTVTTTRRPAAAFLRRARSRVR